MAKINVTVKNFKGKFKHKGKNYRFGEVFSVDETDKNIQAGIKIWAIKKVHSEPVKKETKEVDKKTDVPIVEEKSPPKKNKMW